MGVTWSEEARAFFAKAEDNSIDLHFVVSYDCESQTKARFLMFVKSLQQEPIRRKIHKIFIIDTAYLQRFCDHKSFTKYADASLITPWQQENKTALEELSKAIPCETISWATFINKKEFDEHRKRIKLDFAGDETGQGKDEKFRSIVLSLAAQNTHKCPLKEGCDYIIEECAQAFFLRNTVIAYPMHFNAAISHVIAKYSLNISRLSYKVSGAAPVYQSSETPMVASTSTATFFSCTAGPHCGLENTSKLHEKAFTVQQMAFSDSAEGNTAVIMFVGSTTTVGMVASQFLQNITVLGLFGKEQKKPEKGEQPSGQQESSASTAATSATS